MNARASIHHEWQVVVVGAGHAGLCAGIAARQAGAESVVVLEAAPKDLRGGNSALTKSVRFPWHERSYIAALLDEPDDRRVDTLLAGRREYTEDDYLDDWLRVSGSQVDAALIESIIHRANSAITWMHGLGQRWVPRKNPLPGDVPVVFDGGGQGLQDRNFDQYERLGGVVYYENPVTGIEPAAGGQYRVLGSGPAFPLVCDALILASGGFEGNAQMRGHHLGSPWREVKLRGVPFNDGLPLAAAIALGADTAGNWRKCHTTPQGTGLPSYMLPGQMSRSHELTRYAFPRGIVVNRSGRRFFDECAEYSNLAYVTLGQKIMEQPGKIAFQIFDSKVINAGGLPDSYFSDPASIIAPSLEDGARQLGIDIGQLRDEVARLNGDKHAVTHIDTPPYLFAPVVSGLTFTYGGLSVTENAEVRGGGAPIDGLYAAGVIVGGLYDQGYPAGTGLMAGAVLGRAAGTHAAEHARRAGAV
ncbi:FAD-dependent oxidoreductase [Nocardia brasiliensis]|uniref:FAD-dependent oxidoreductase n=1 Tax=Nocardia brasiliensis TaxID=37326 RepID=UPI0002F10683|nr:FAD-dependent oxidoreductase [Nocardia brasiliensis]